MINLQKRLETKNFTHYSEFPFFFHKDDAYSSGSVGSYFNVEYRRDSGVKVFFETEISKNVQAINLCWRAKSGGVNDYIAWEAAFMNAFYGKRIATVRICFDRSNHSKYLGIRMPHFSGFHPQGIINSFYDPKKDKCYLKMGVGRAPLLMAINSRAAEVGFQMLDVHEHNVVIDRLSRPWPIDFGSSSIQVFKKTKSLQREFEWVLKDLWNHYKKNVKYRDENLSQNKTT